ncbi:hypothetical protein J3F83DRAFT_747844 [Trichoderma novae-zelandiae]
MSSLVSPHNLTRGEVLGIWTPGHLVGRGPSCPATVAGGGWTSRVRSGHQLPKSGLDHARIWPKICASVFCPCRAPFNSSCLREYGGGSARHGHQ